MPFVGRQWQARTPSGGRSFDKAQVTNPLSVGMHACSSNMFHPYCGDFPFPVGFILTFNVIQKKCGGRAHFVSLILTSWSKVMVPKTSCLPACSVSPEVRSNFNKSRNIKQECFKWFKISLKRSKIKGGKSTDLVYQYYSWFPSMASENFSLWKPVALSPSQQWGSICWKALLKMTLDFLARARAASAARLSVAVFEELAQLGIYIYI